jgi:hypothetical protein
VPLAVIGEMRRGGGVAWLLEGAPAAPARPGFDHFR